MQVTVMSVMQLEASFRQQHHEKVTQQKCMQQSSLQQHGAHVQHAVKVNEL